MNRCIRVSAKLRVRTKPILMEVCNIISKHLKDGHQVYFSDFDGDVQHFTPRDDIEYGTYVRMMYEIFTTVDVKKVTVRCDDDGFKYCSISRDDNEDMCFIDAGNYHDYIEISKLDIAIDKLCEIKDFNNPYICDYVDTFMTLCKAYDELKAATESEDYNADIVKQKVEALEAYMNAVKHQMEGEYPDD